MEESGQDNNHTPNMAKNADQSEKALTKNQLKKLKKKEKWEQVKAQKRKAEKERQKARKKACRERGEELAPTRKQLSKNKMKNSPCKIKVAIDCDFDDYMAEKDIKMLVKQIQHSYSANRRAQSPMQFYCCGIGSKTQERLESLGDYKGWDVYLHSEAYDSVFDESSIVYLSSDSQNVLQTLEEDKIYLHSEAYDSVFDKSSIVYLSSDSPNILQSLEEDKVYIIGGIVDHNHHKGLCHKLAEEKGLSHAQLPITEYIDMKTRKVLTINHVFEILLRYTETQDWQKAFYTVLPQRKGAMLKDKNSDDSKPEVNEQSKDNNYRDGDNQDKSEHDVIVSNNKSDISDEFSGDSHGNNVVEPAVESNIVLDSVDNLDNELKERDDKTESAKDGLSSEKNDSSLDKGKEEELDDKELKNFDENMEER